MIYPTSNKLMRWIAILKKWLCSESDKLIAVVALGLFISTSTVFASEVLEDTVTGHYEEIKCLPKNIRLDSVVSFKTSTSADGKKYIEALTVKRVLKTLKARCVRGELKDRSGKSIRFYQLHGCWGNPPTDYLEIMEKQRKDLEELKKKYKVIERTCSSGSPERIS